MTLLIKRHIYLLAVILSVLVFSSERPLASQPIQLAEIDVTQAKANLKLRIQAIKARNQMIASKEKALDRGFAKRNKAFQAGLKAERDGKASLSDADYKASITAFEKAARLFDIVGTKQETVKIKEQAKSDVKPRPLLSKQNAQPRIQAIKTRKQMIISKEKALDRGVLEDNQNFQHGLVAQTEAQQLLSQAEYTKSIAVFEKARAFFNAAKTKSPEQVQQSISFSPTDEALKGEYLDATTKINSRDEANVLEGARMIAQLQSKDPDNKDIYTAWLGRAYFYIDRFNDACLLLSQTAAKLQAYEKNVLRETVIACLKSDPARIKIACQFHEKYLKSGQQKDFKIDTSQCAK